MNSKFLLLTNEESSKETIENDVGVHFNTTLTFQSKENLIDWAQTIAKKLGFVIIILRADKITDRATPRVILGCDRSRLPRAIDNKKGYVKRNIRKSSSKRCGCAFVLKGYKLETNLWTIEVKHAIHNHAFVHLEAHPYAGRLDDNEEKIVEEMYNAGCKPRKILSALKKRNPENSTSIRTIYNTKAKLYRTALEGGTAIQHLFKCINDSGYISFTQVNQSTLHLESIFFAHPTAVRLSNMFSSTFMVDCTYKTNRYRLPLLSIVGVTSTNQSFFSSFAFLSNENEGSYKWALECFKHIFDENVVPIVFVTDREIALMNAIKDVFPQAKNLLCQVHINRNILANCKKFFAHGKDCDIFLGVWQRIVNSQSENEFHIHFEHVLMEEQELKKKLAKRLQKVTSTRSGFLENVKKQMPAITHAHIIDVIDVMGDGHCGYRVISTALNLGDNWMQVRHDLAGEVHEKALLYTEIFGTSRRLELLKSLDCWMTPAPLDKWMSMPDMGLIVASCYNIQLVHLSCQQSFTFLPLHSAPPVIRRVIFMGFINENHFVQLRMKEDCPLPPIFPVWRRYHEYVAEQWDVPYITRLI